MSILNQYIEPLLTEHFDQQVDVLRLDKLHGWVSGNKLLKLQGWLHAFQQGNYKSLVSFGGAHSNHLHALAFVAYRQQIPLFLYVRAYEHQPLTATLRDCQALGATLIFTDKKAYAKRYDAGFWTELGALHQALVIPEGGSGVYGEEGCRALAPIAAHYQQVWLAVGTGSTALGLARELERLNIQTTEIVGVNAVSDRGERLRAWQEEMPISIPWKLIDDAHFGGFGNFPSELRALVHKYDAHNLPLDPVYTAKLMHAFEQRNAHNPHQRILLVHTGGLQGRRGVGLSVDEVSFDVSRF